MTIPPIRAIFDGNALIPSGTHLSVLREHLGAGEVVTLDLEMSRSMKSHGHQFAWLKTAWDNLPDRMADEPWARTPDTLRKWALIRTGWGEAAQVDCGNADAAARVHPMMLAQAMKANGYAEAHIRGPVLTLVTPRSQSVRAMGGEAFRQSKAGVLDHIAALLEVSPETLEKSA